MRSPGTLPLMGGHPQFVTDPLYRAISGRDKFHPNDPTAPDPKKLAQGSPQPGKTMRSPGTPLHVGIRKSALTPHIKPRLEKTSFTQPHQTPKPQKTTAPDDKKFAQGSPQPGKTMGSPDTLPLMGGHQ